MAEDPARDRVGGDPVAWIETIPEAKAAGELAELYAREKDPKSGRVDAILKVHSLHPRSLDDHARLYHTIMHGDSGLSLAERELMGVVVSTLNGCHY